VDLLSLAPPPRGCCHMVSQGRGVPSHWREAAGAHGVVSAPPTAPTPAPIAAPVAGLPPVTAAAPAPTPAPIRPPVTARVPGSAPQAATQKLSSPISRAREILRCIVLSPSH